MASIGSGYAPGWQIEGAMAWAAVGVNGKMTGPSWSVGTSAVITDAKTSKLAMRGERGGRSVAGKGEGGPG